MSHVPYLLSDPSDTQTPCSPNSTVTHPKAIDFIKASDVFLTSLSLPLRRSHDFQFTEKSLEMQKLTWYGMSVLPKPAFT